jgi:hypothetical protein
MHFRPKNVPFRRWFAEMIVEAIVQAVAEVVASVALQDWISAKLSRQPVTPMDRKRERARRRRQWRRLLWE